MQTLLEWIKNYIVLVLFLTALLSLVAKKEYRSYIRFFMELVMVIALISPILKFFGGSGKFLETVEYESFWQELTNIREDAKKVTYVDDAYYMAQYEEAIGRDIELMASGEGYALEEITVKLNESYSITSVNMRIGDEKKNNIIIGTIDLEAENTEQAPGDYTKLKQKIAEYYQIDEGSIHIDG